MDNDERAQREKEAAEALDRALDGGSLDDADLGSLVSAAEQVKDSTQVQMSAVASDRILNELLGRTRIPGVSKKRSPFRRFILKPAAALLAAMLIIGPSTAALAQDATPDDTLYGVKLATENLQLLIEGDTNEDARLHVEFANRRLDEIAAHPGARGLSRALENLEGHLADAEALLADSDDLFATNHLLETQARNTEVLQGLIGEADCDKADPDAGDPQCKGLLNAFENSTKHLDDDHPSNTQPGPPGDEGPPFDEDPSGLNGSDDPFTPTDPQDKGQGSERRSPRAP